MQMRRAFILAAAALPFTFGAASAQEKQIKQSELPPAVARAVAEQSKGATIRDLTVETEKGKTYYEAEMMVNGHSKDVLFGSDGTVLEIEEQVTLDALPPKVRSELQAKAAGAEIVKIESVTRHGKLMQYDADIRRNGKRSEISVKVGG